MKKAFFVLVILGSCLGIVLAQKETPITVSVATRQPEIKSIVAKVESVALADPVNGIKSRIVVKDEAGNKYTFLVKASTAIYAVDWKAASLDNINKEDKVKIKFYTTKEGVNETVSINIIK